MTEPSSTLICSTLQFLIRVPPFFSNSRHITLVIMPKPPLYWPPPPWSIICFMIRMNSRGMIILCSRAMRCTVGMRSPMLMSPKLLVRTGS